LEADDDEDMIEKVREEERVALEAQEEKKEPKKKSPTRVKSTPKKTP